MSVPAVFTGEDVLAVRAFELRQDKAFWKYLWVLMVLVGFQPWSAREFLSAHLTYTSEPVLNLGKLEEVKERGSETQMKRFQVEDYGVIIRR